MAAPNILNLTTATAKTTGIAGTTVMGNVVVNAVNSSAVNKLNSLTIANYTGSTLGAWVDIYRGGTTYSILAGNIAVPAYSTMVVLAKDMTVYLEEGDALRANVSANSAAYITSSYEILV